MTIPSFEYLVEVLIPEEPRSRGLIWQKEWRVRDTSTGVAWRVVHGKFEIGIFDNPTSAHDVRNNLNTVMETRRADLIRRVEKLDQEDDAERLRAIDILDGLHRIDALHDQAKL